MAVKRDRGSDRTKAPPLDATALERLALGYVGRYATTRAKLAAYLARKLGERGWAGDRSADVDGLVARLAALGYVDDRAWATARGAALTRRGYGARRLDGALRSAGVASDDSVEARDAAVGMAWQAALALARRRRIGPYASAPPDEAAQRRAFAMMIRAGHDVAIAQRIVRSTPGELIEDNY